MLGLFDSLGYTTFVKNGLASQFGTEQGNCAGTYVGLEQPDGLGDGSDGLADNRPLLIDAAGRARPVDFTRTVSPVGAALHSWAAGVVPAPSPDPVVGPPTPTPPQPVVDVKARVEAIRDLIDALLHDLP